MENVVRPLLLIINILFIGLSGCEEPNRIKHLIDYSAKDSSGVECGDFGMFSEKAVEIDGPITNAKAGVVGGMTTDSQGNLYFTDLGYHTIRVIKTNGEVEKVVGQSGEYGCNDGKNHEAHLFNPWGIAIDNNGLIYFTDHFMVRKVDLDGSVTTIAGVSNKMGKADGKGREAGFWNYQIPIAIGPDENLYVGDQGAVRRVTQDGVVTTLAGIVNRGGAEVDGVGVNAKFDFIRSIVVDTQNVIYVISNGYIRKINKDGEVTTLALFDIKSEKNCFANSLSIDTNDDLHVRFNSGILKISSPGKLNNQSKIKLDCNSLNLESNTAPNVMAFDMQDNLYGIGYDNDIVQIAPSGETRIIAYSGSS